MKKRTKTMIPVIIAFTLIDPLTIPGVSAPCAAESLEWCEPCNDTEIFSDGIGVKYSILNPVLILAIPASCALLLVYWRKNHNNNPQNRHPMMF